jgi:alkylation response protein AidB-like acyl-CoA dehydrogenase
MTAQVPAGLERISASLEQLTARFAADAAAVDRAGQIPAEHLGLLAEAGLYGAFAPAAAGGLGLSAGELCGVVEELAAACLASTFVWIQHFGLLGTLLDPGTPAPLRALLPAVVSGEIKGGLALAGLLPGPPRLRAEPDPRGWLVTGESPWVSGWGVVDMLYLVARGPNDTVVSLLVDATEQEGLRVEPQQLIAVNASATARLVFSGLAVDGERCAGQRPFEPGRQLPEGLRINGSLALGVARRCCALLGPSPLDQELGACRAALDAAGPEDMPAARARAAAFAQRAAAALVVSRGSAAALAGDPADRLTREAAFILVFGSRPAIKAALLQALTGPAGPGGSQAAERGR